MFLARISEQTIEEVNAVSILDLADALGVHTKRVGKQYQIPCPNPGHQARVSDNTFIEPNKNLFKCFACEASGSSAFSYYFWHEYGRGYDKTNLEDKKAFPKIIEEIAKLIGIPILYDDGSYVKSEKQYRPRVKQIVELEPLSDKVCDQVYRAFLSLCPIRQEHAVEWLQERRYSKDDVVSLSLRSVPSPEELVPILQKLIAKGYPIARVPGFVQRLMPPNLATQYPPELLEEDSQGRGYWVWTLSSGKGGYFIPVRDRFSRIVRLRVKRPAGKPKYIWFSSTDNTAIETKTALLRKNGVSSGAPLHIAPPVSQLKVWEVGTDLADIHNVSVVIATEGEHKAQVSANFLNVVLIGIPGVGNFEPVIPLLRDWGTKKFILAYDMDTLKREDDSLKSQQKQKRLFDILTEFAKEVMKLGIEVLLWTWDIKDGKGLDDLLQHRKLPFQINLRTGERKLVDLKQLYEVA